MGVSECRLSARRDALTPCWYCISAEHCDVVVYGFVFVPFQEPRTVSLPELGVIYMGKGVVCEFIETKRCDSVRSISERECTDLRPRRSL
jgi:hypothetical protein